ncbi:MAG: glutamine amidotransferase [Actinomycetota bacterium]|nr:glutamine amidotransferase [Actinomycetota bacterium]
MCGIIGLHLRNPDLQPRLGELLSAMLEAMTSRGPDSAGLAVYSDGESPGDGGQWRYSLRSDADTDWDLLAKDIAAATGGEVTARPLTSGAALLLSTADEHAVLPALGRVAPRISVVGHGRAITVVKEVGAPADICAAYGIGQWSGYQGVGHTRMATESAVTTAHSHPFAPAADLALVHNGSFSNYSMVRRKLAKQGVLFDTDNDSEVAARLVALRMAAGDDLEEALRHVLKEMDGFFTLLVTTANQFAVVRDSFACKPAVIAQTADYVAMASEYQALAGLPGIADADVFEPMPEEIYTWTR